MTQTETAGRPPLNPDALRADLAKARALVSALCQEGEKHWRMCVPVQDDDSDVLLSRIFRHTEDLLAALREQEEARQGWQPIDTAPKDGSMVLLYRETAYTARWLHSEVMGPVWATPDGHVVFRATYWMPIPDAPTTLTPEVPDAD
jgi:hypothetical protein